LLGLAWIKPNDIKEKSPGHKSWSCPNKPCGRKNDEHRCDLIEQQNRKHPSVVRPLARNDLDFSRRSARGRSHYEFGALLIGDETKPSQGSHRTRASERAYGNAAHLCKIEPITDAQTGPKRGRRSLI
jgi:hypothetical protein